MNLRVLPVFKFKYIHALNGNVYRFKRPLMKKKIRKRKRQLGINRGHADVSYHIRMYQVDRHGMVPI